MFRDAGRRRRAASTGRAGAALLLAVLLVTAGACSRGVPAPSSTTPVILISIDTLRSDHLPAYGYTKVATPNIDALRADGILYEHAYSHVPLTLPSHATMLTGKLPADTGVRDNRGYQLRSDVPTIAELLKKNGYATGAAVSAFVLKGTTGISRGFDFYDDDVRGGSIQIAQLQRSGEETTKIASNWIDEHQKSPFFFFLHLYEPHSPYTPPEPFKSQYASSPYDGEIAEADRIVGTLIDHLKSSGLYDKAMIILLSDHGEGLGEHGEEEHGIFLYRESLQVPLIVKLPGEAMKHKSVSTPVELIDLLPTIAEQTKTTFNRSAYQGVSLLSMLADGQQPARRIYSESYYAKIHCGWSDLHSLISGNDHYIQAPRPELYDLHDDPAELKNVLQQNRRAYVALKNAIVPMIHTADTPSAVSPEEAAKLAALGYLGSTAGPASGERADPKEKIGTLRTFQNAVNLYVSGRDQEAVPLFEQVLADNPGMADAWEMLARGYARQERYEEAIATAKRGLKIAPHMTALALLIGELDLRLGNLDEARKHAELAVDDDPADAHSMLARIFLAGHDAANAEREANLALASDRNSSGALMTLAAIAHERGHDSDALALLERTEAALRASNRPDVSHLHFLRGEILARVGRTDDAEREYRQEIALFPAQPDAYRSLLLLYAKLQRPRLQFALINHFIEAAPQPATYVSVVEWLRIAGNSDAARYWANAGASRFPGDRDLRKLAGM